MNSIMLKANMFDYTTSEETSWIDSSIEGVINSAFNFAHIDWHGYLDCARVAQCVTTPTPSGWTVLIKAYYDGTEQTYVIEVTK